MRKLSLIAALTLAGLPLSAEDAALLLGNERYTTLNRLIGAGDILDAGDALTRLGFSVQSLANATKTDTMPALQAFVSDAADADRIVVALSGRFATDGTRTWYLTSGASPTLFAVPWQGVSLESVMAVMAAAPGQAVLVLGADMSEDETFDTYLREGLGRLDVPQGVTVVLGDTRSAGDFLSDVIATPGSDLMDAVADNRRLSVVGYAPDMLVLVPQDTVAVTETPGPVVIVDTAAEQALWDGARALDTADAYRNYLSRYPSGQYVSDANRLIAEIATEPNRPARLAEEALGLARDARRDIQRDLTILNFDPRGIDGIFGPGTRSAIANWQQQTGYSQTTYLNAEQINRLDAQAARRAAELEAEADRARAEQLRLDRAYWEETGARGDEPGLRAYLERYPDGAFAQQATDALAVIEEQKRQQAAAEDNAAWDRAVAANSVDGYRTYLQVFPQGAFQAEAEARIAALTQPAQQDNAAATAAENALGLNAITLRLVEARLEQLGLEPGGVDGQFDDASRRAIRNFQRDRSLDITGFLNEQTIVRLLADGFSALGK